MEVWEIVKRLRANANPKNVAGMAKYGINPEGTLGLSMPFLRGLAKEIGKDHGLAQELWNSGIHEARLLAGFIAEPDKVTPELMDRWAGNFDSWDVCDQVCTILFDKTPHAYSKAIEWSRRAPEFVKRAAFAVMAGLAVHDKRAPDKKLSRFLPVIRREAGDGRNYVRKAANWALRNIGKRSVELHGEAIRVSERILKDAAGLRKRGDLEGARSASWIATDALRELRGPYVRKRLARVRKNRA